MTSIVECGVRKVHFKDFFYEAASSGPGSMWVTNDDTVWSVALGNGAMPYGNFRGEGLRMVADVSVSGEKRAFVDPTALTWGKVDQTTDPEIGEPLDQYDIRFRVNGSWTGSVFFMYYMTLIAGAPSEGFRIRFTSTTMYLEKYNAGWQNMQAWSVALNADTDYYMRVTYVPTDLELVQNDEETNLETEGTHSIQIATSRVFLGWPDILTKTIILGGTQPTPGTTLGFGVDSQDAEFWGTTFTNGFAIGLEYVNRDSVLVPYSEKMTLAFGGNGLGRTLFEKNDRVEIWNREKRRYLGRYYHFTSGSIEPTPGDTLVGATSGSEAELLAIKLQTGSWALGTAAGVFFVDAEGDIFSSENIDNLPDNDVMTTDGVSTPPIQYFSFPDFDGRVNEVNQAERDMTVTVFSELYFGLIKGDSDLSLGQGDSYLDGFATMFGEYMGNGQVSPRTSINGGVDQSSFNGTATSDFTLKGQFLNKLSTLCMLDTKLVSWGPMGHLLAYSDPVQYEGGTFSFNNKDLDVNMEVPLFGPQVHRKTMVGFATEHKTYGNNNDPQLSTNATLNTQYGAIRSVSLMENLPESEAAVYAGKKKGQLAYDQDPLILVCMGYRTDLQPGMGVLVQLKELGHTTDHEMLCVRKEYWWTNNPKKYEILANVVKYHLVDHAFSSEGRLPRPVTTKGQTVPLKLMDLTNHLLETA